MRQDDGNKCYGVRFFEGHRISADGAIICAGTRRRRRDSETFNVCTVVMVSVETDGQISPGGDAPGFDKGQGDGGELTAFPHPG